MHNFRTKGTTSYTMKFLKSINTISILEILLILISADGQSQPSNNSNTKPRQVDVVICIDLSGSTNGLIDNFRDKMWDIINQWQMFTPKPVIRIGLIGFSRYSFHDGSGYIKIISDLTDDYDALSQKMFDIQPYVENGIQFVGAAIGSGVNDMSWSQKPDAVKMMFVMGNGYVNLGRFDFRAQCESAVKSNIEIHTVYCIKNDKQMRQRELPGWEEIAKMTGGQSFQVLVNKRAPLIKEKVNVMALASLNDSLNKTFIPYGKAGVDRLKLMLKADDHAVRSYEAYFYSRLKYKLSDHYTSQMLMWDVTQYKEEYPQSRLSAVRQSVKSNNESSVDLELLAKEFVEKRNSLRASINALFPVGEELRIHNEAIAEEYELENRLDKTMVRAYSQTLLKSGFKE